MSTCKSKELVRFSLRAAMHRSAWICLIALLILMGRGLTQAESLTKSVAQGGIRGKITDQSGRSLANIQVMAIKQPETSFPYGYYAYGYSTPYDIGLLPPWMPKELSQELNHASDPYLYPYRPYGSYGLYVSSSDFLPPEVYQTLSAADGSFSLTGLPEGRYRLWAYDSDSRKYAPSIFGLDASQAIAGLYYYPSSNSGILVKVKSGQTTEPINLSMSLAGKLSGKVVDAATGSPISGARIQAMGPYCYPPFWTLSDSSGKFTFSALPEGEYRLSAMAEGYIAGYSGYGQYGLEDVYKVLPGQEISGCTLSLKLGGAVSGRITSQVDGKPIAGAEVICFMTADQPGYVVSSPVLSQADGTYQISGLEPGSYVPLVQYAPGFQGAYCPNTQDREQARQIVVEAGVETGSADIQLAPIQAKGIIRGRIIDKASGLPVAGIQVSLTRLDYEPYIGPLLPTEPGKVIIMRNRAEAVAGSAPAAGTASSPTVITSSPNAYDAPVATPQASLLMTPATSDTGMAMAGYVSSSSPGLSSYHLPYDPSYSPAGEPSPLSYLPSVAAVRINPVLTDEQGRFEFGGLENGKYELTIYDPQGNYLGSRYPEYPAINWADSYLPPEYLELSEKKTLIEGIEISLVRGGCLEGKVLAGSAPLAGIYVSAMQVNMGYKGRYYYYGGSGSQDVTDTAGEFTIRGLAEGEYMLVARDEIGNRNYLATFCQSAGEDKPQVFKVTSGSTTSGLVIYMKPGASISGRVLDQAGAPLAGIAVSANIEQWPALDPNKPWAYYSLSTSASAMTAKDGTYTLVGLSEGSYVLRAWDKDQIYLEGCQSGLTVSATDSLFAPDMVLTKSSILSGKVTSSTDGQPLANILILATRQYLADYSSTGNKGEAPAPDEAPYAYSDYCGASQITYQAQAYTDKDGTYRICGLAAGSYQLEAQDYQREYLPVQYGLGASPGLVSVALGEEKSGLDFSLVRGGMIRGTVRDAVSGEPVSGVTIMAQMVSQLGYSGSSQASGGGYPTSGSSGYVSYYGLAYSVPPPAEVSYGYAAVPPEAGAGALMLKGEQPISEASRGSLYIKMIRGQIGQEVEIPIILSTGPREVFSLGFELVYDPGALEYLGFEKGTLASSLSMFDASLIEPGRIRVGGYSFVASIPSEAADELIILKFKVDGGLLNQCYPLELENLMDDLAGFTANSGFFCTGTAEPAGTYAGPSPTSMPAEPASGLTVEPMISALPMVMPVSTLVAPVEPPPVPPSGITPPSSGLTNYGQYPAPEMITGGIYASTPTDGLGRYILRGLPPGKYLLFVSPAEKNYQVQYYGGTDENEAAPIEIAAEQVIENINFNLTAGIILKGTVKDATSGKPITTGCSVSLTTEQGSYLKTTYTNLAGEYQFSGLRPGSYLVTASGCQDYHDGSYRLPGTDPKASSPISVSAPGPIEGIDILLQPKASISGLVVDEFDKKPLPKILIAAIPKSLSSPFYSSIYSSDVYPYPYYGSQAITDADGRYTIKGLEEGDYLILARDPAHIYGQEYYQNVPVSQPNKAAVIHVSRSEAKAGIDLELQVGETYSGQGSSSGQAQPATTSQNYGYSSGSLAITGSSNLYGSSTFLGGAGYGAIDPSRQAQWGELVTGQNPAQPSPSSQQQVPANVQPPQIISSNSVDKIKAGRTFKYQLKVDSQAANNDLLTYSLTLGPEGMEIDPNTGLVQWKPSNQDAGSHIVQILVDNGYGQIASQAFRLRVEEDTTPPPEITNLTAVKGDGKVILSWTPPVDRDEDLADQILYIGEGKEYGAGISLGKNTRGYTVENLKNGQSYTFKIVAVDVLGNASREVTTSATPAKEQTAAAGGGSTTFWPSWYSVFPSTNPFLGNTTLGGLWGNSWLSSLNAPSIWSASSLWSGSLFNNAWWGNNTWNTWWGNNTWGMTSSLWASPSWSSLLWPGSASVLGGLGDSWWNYPQNSWSWKLNW